MAERSGEIIGDMIALDTGQTFIKQVGYEGVVEIQDIGGIPGRRYAGSMELLCEYTPPKLAITDQDKYKDQWNPTLKKDDVSGF